MILYKYEVYRIIKHFTQSNDDKKTKYKDILPFD